MAKRMTARTRRLLALALLLVALSAALYVLQLVLYRDPASLGSGLVSQLAFLPLYFLFSTIVVDTALVRKDREDRLRKLNVVVGVFFREIGEELFGLAAGRLQDPQVFAARIRVDSTWKEAEFATARRECEAGTYRFTLTPEAMDGMARLLRSHRDVLLRLMENPSLVEHEGFTELILAVSHLSDEFDRRASLEGLPQADQNHVEGDLRRAFVLLSTQWLSYALHLKKEYPYLYSLILRVGPFGAGSATAT